MEVAGGPRGAAMEAATRAVLAGVAQIKVVSMVSGQIVEVSMVEGQRGDMAGPGPGRMSSKGNRIALSPAQHGEEVPPQEPRGDPRWEPYLGEKEDKHDGWVTKVADSSNKAIVPDPTPAQTNKGNEVTALEAREPCQICGYNNHSTSECRRMLCEICGCNTHVTYDCINCLPWNYGPELCAAQVEGQGFFHIDEIIDPKVAREKASTAVISIISGSVSAKDIEHMFMNLLGSDAWCWTVRPMNESTFVMRFPTAKMVKEWSQIKTMFMKGCEAKIQIDSWSQPGVSKGQLQMGWFRVTNIPRDQRSIITLAKVGGLVGKVMEIDEKSRYIVDYVRLKIACRDISKVPKTAEGVLGLTVYDFGFEREIAEDNNEKVLKSGIKVTEGQPPNKKPRAEGAYDNLKNDKEGGSSSIVAQQNKAAGKQVMTAPPKMVYKQPDDGGAKFMKDAQKAYRSDQVNSDEEKVYIHENIEESDSESDSFSERLRKLNEGQSSKQDNKNDQAWFVQLNETNLVPDTHDKIIMNDGLCGATETMGSTKEDIPMVMTNSPEVFMADDNIIHTQESQN